LRSAWDAEEDKGKFSAAWRWYVRASASADQGACRSLLGLVSPDSCNDADAAEHVAVAAHGVGDTVVAEIWGRRASVLNPDKPGGWWNWGMAARALGHTEDALHAIRNAHRLLPDEETVTVYLVATLIDGGLISEAMPHVIRLAQSSTLGVTDLMCCGMAAWRNHDRPLAVDFFLRAAEMSGDDGLIEDTTLGLMTETGKFDETRPFADRLLKKALADDDALYRYAYRSIYLADWRDREALRARIGESFERYVSRAKLSCNLLWGIAGYGFDYAHDMKICREIAKEYDQPTMTLATRGRRTKIRVGWIQASTSFHSTMIATRNLVQRSDRGRFEVIGYGRRDTNFREGDPSYEFQKEFRRSFDRFSNLTGMSDEDAAKTVLSDDLDILIDMQGLNENNNMGVVGRHPARVTALYYGFCHSTGSARVDYLFSDRIFMTRDFIDAGSEKIVFLPGCQLAPTLGTISPEEISRGDYGLPDDGIVLCNFNNPWKHDPVTFESWMTILRRVPKAVLWLAAWNDSAVVNLKRSAGELGIDPARVMFADVADHSQHLKRIGLADLALDGFYNGGGVTTLDTLWGGVPMISALGLVGITMARMGATMLNAALLPELVVNSRKDYEDLAVALCNDRERLANLRRHLVQGRATLPIFDIAAAARHVDRACELMFENWAAGKPPRHLEVEPLWSAGR
jgi:tetratricopeptide (TPR) repeat protein